MDVYEHIQRQVWTSVPAFVIALAVFFVLGLAHVGETEDTVSTTTELDALSDVFWITPVNLLPLVLLAYLSIRKVPASLALMASALFAGVLGAFLQPDVVAAFVSGTGNVVVESIKAVWQAMANGLRHRHRARRGRPAAVPRRHGLHAAHPLADLRRGDLRRRCSSTSA